MKTRSEIFLIADQINWEQLGEGVRRQIMAYDGQMMMVKVEFQSGAVGAMHDHYHSQGCLVVSGSFEVTIDNKTRELAAGDGFYVEPDAKHGVLCTKAGVLLDVFTPMRADFLKKK